MVACRSKGCLTFCGLLIIMSVWLFGFMGMVMCYWIDGFDSLGQNHKIGLFSEFVNSTGCNWSSGEDWIEAELLGVVQTCCVLGPICSTMALFVGFVPCVLSSDRRYATVTALLSWISGALGAIGVAIFDVNVNLHSRAERGPGFYLYAIWIVLNVLGGILIFVGGQSCENVDGDSTRSRILTPSLDLQQEQQRQQQQQQQQQHRSEQCWQQIQSLLLKKMAHLTEQELKCQKQEKQLQQQQQQYVSLLPGQKLRDSEEMRLWKRRIQRETEQLSRRKAELMREKQLLQMELERVWEEEEQSLQQEQLHRKEQLQRQQQQQQERTELHHQSDYNTFPRPSIFTLSPSQNQPLHTTTISSGAASVVSPPPSYRSPPPSTSSSLPPSYRSPPPSTSSSLPPSYRSLPPLYEPLVSDPLRRLSQNNPLQISMISPSRRQSTRPTASSFATASINSQPPSFRSLPPPYESIELQLMGER